MSTATFDAKNGIYLTQAEADLFIIFRRYQCIWAQIFGEINKNKKIELHFDQYGVLEFAKTDKRYYNN